VLFVTEKNRDSMKNGNGGQSTGAGSRKIEYGAETVISLLSMKDSKGNVIEENGDGEKPVTLLLAKNRHGAVNKPVKLTFNGALQRFKSAG
jgi:replicative DNA helicase